VAANDGNITVRLDDERLLATPTGVSKGMMSPDDLIMVDMQGKKLAGHSECTSELGLHLAVYQLRPDVQSVVHAHPPVATGFATAGKALNLALLPEVIISLGCVPLADYGLPGTAEITAPMLPLIPNHDALLMANHGAVCFGGDVWQAYFRMETIEHYARVALVAELLGGPKVLPQQEVDKLMDARARYGVTAPAGDGTGPVAAEDAASAARRFQVTRAELIGMVDEILRARGIA
jgi:L-fuculose-phosphate aldolase